MTNKTALIVKLNEWFKTPFGQYVLAWEYKQFDQWVADIFGYHAVQVGFTGFDLLRNNRISFKAYVDSALPNLSQIHDTSRIAGVVAYPEALPFASQSIDLLVLPHALECSVAPHLILREVERVLVPEGRVIIAGFNPWSLLTLCYRLSAKDQALPLPASMRISLVRLRDWLKLLSFEMDQGCYGCYAPTFKTEKWRKRWHFLEAAGDRWWAACGAVYMVSAVKRVVGMRLIGPAWKKKPQLAHSLPSPVNYQNFSADSPIHTLDSKKFDE